MDVWWNNHFLCNDWESSNWNNHKKVAVWGSRDKSFGGKFFRTYSNQHNKQMEELLAALFSNSFAKGISVKYSSSGAIFWGGINAEGWCAPTRLDNVEGFHPKELCSVWVGTMMPAVLLGVGRKVPVKVSQMVCKVRKVRN